MKNIIIVQCASTGKNYVQDIIDRNYNPIVLELKPLDDTDEARESIEKSREVYKEIECDFKLIYEKDNYEDTLEMVREYDPLLVVPGTENGVILATRLANDLNLLCNPIENIDAYTLKDEMQNKLAENNLRSIKGQVVHSIEEAVNYYDNENLNKVVVKPTLGTSSVGVRLCADKQEMINALEEGFNSVGYYGNELKEFVVQERIDGDEYIVNTVSCNGTHRITTIWKYTKIKTSEGGNIYDHAITVNELEIGESELVEYAYDVADALGIKYGTIHGEFMIDENGPVLIEVNCRPMGPSLDSKFMDRISGQHETDSALDAYLNPEKFNFERLKGYKMHEYGIIKTTIVPEDILAKSSPFASIGIHLKSLSEMRLISLEEPTIFHKTQDLATSGGAIFLAHEDYTQIQKDLNFIRDIEKRAFQLVLSEEKHENIPIDGDEIYRDIESLLKTVKPYGTSLLVTDTVYDNLDAYQVLYDDLDSVRGNFDCVTINLNKSLIDMNDVEIVKLLVKIFDKVKFGGLIFIPKTTYEFLPSSRLGAEALLKLLDYDLKLPIHQFNRMIIALKK